MGDRGGRPLKGRRIGKAGTALQGAVRHRVGQRDRTARAGGTIQEIERRPAGKAELAIAPDDRSEEHTSELQSLMRISYAVFCLKKKKTSNNKDKKANKTRQRVENNTQSTKKTTNKTC